MCLKFTIRLAAESVEGASLALERVHHVERSHGLPLRVLSVGDRVTNNVLKESSEHRSRLFVDERRDALDTTTAREASDGRLGDAEDGLLE